MVNNYQYINIREILSRILRHPLLQDLNLETAIQYTVDFFGIMGLPSTYIDKVATVEINNFRGVMPCDLISINQVSYKGNCIAYMTDNFNDCPHNTYTFKTQGRIIYTSFKEGCVDISYKAMAVDNEGLPLLPDEPTFLRALELYIKKHNIVCLNIVKECSIDFTKRVDKSFRVLSNSLSSLYPGHKTI